MEHAHGRLHALDGLRATMMLLGLVLHSSVSYGVVDYGAAWPYKDPATTIVVDLIVYFIHVFRMPVFFVLAGFFAALLYLRRGPGGLARNRAMRIVVPFAVGWVILCPLAIGGFIFANAEKSGSIAMGSFEVIVRQSGIWGLFGDTTRHLWFLYDLIFFYLAALGLAPLVERLPATFRARTLRVFESVVSRPLLRTLAPASLTAATLLPMGGWLRTSTSFMPDPLVLLAYGVFFGFGWLLCLKHDLLASFERLAWTQTLLGVALLLATVPLLQGLPESRDSQSFAVVLRSVIGGGGVWLLVFGLTGLFLRHLDRQLPVVRYVADSSYWVYLVHLPCTIWISGLLAEIAWSPWLKILVVLGGTTVIGFTTYDLLVRSSFIGLILNGRRSPRGLPVPETIVALRTEPVPGRSRGSERNAARADDRGAVTDLR